MRSSVSPSTRSSSAIKRVADYRGVRSAITNLDKRIETSRASTASKQRRRNIDTIKGLIGSHFVDRQPKDKFGDHAVTDVDAIIRRSEIETPHYELKQGMLRLDDDRSVDENVPLKVVQTICAIANNGKERSGTIIIGVANKKRDADRIFALDGVEGRKVTMRRIVVGVNREAKVLGETAEQYFSRWKNAIRGANLSSGLKGDVLSSLSYSDYYGLGVIVIRIPPQQAVSLLDERFTSDPAMIRSKFRTPSPYWKLASDLTEEEGFKKIIGRRTVRLSSIEARIRAIGAHSPIGFWAALVLVRSRQRSSMVVKLDGRFSLRVERRFVGVQPVCALEGGPAGVPRAHTHTRAGDRSRSA